MVAGRQAISQDWWENESWRFELRISALVEEEISRGDASALARRQAFIAGIPSFAISDMAIDLAESLIGQGGIPTGSEKDALHIAIAATQGADHLLTWNFKHINNAETKRMIVNIVGSLGYPCPLLCSPEELGGNSGD